MIITGVLLFAAVTAAQVLLARAVADKLTQLESGKASDFDPRFVNAH